MKIYFSLIHSHLTYGAAIWGHCNKRLINDLKILQKRALKTVFKLPRQTSSKLLYDTSGVIPLDKYIKSCSAVLIFKSLKFGARQTGNYILRTDLHLPIPACRTTKFGKNGVLYKAVSIYRLFEK